MNTVRNILRFFLSLMLMSTSTSHAHRAEGLLQATLVEVLPQQINVEITLQPGIDIASSLILQLDTNRDGLWTENESSTWTQSLLEHQHIFFDATPLQPRLTHFEASPLGEFSGGHGEIKVVLSAPLPSRTKAEEVHSIVVSNGYTLPTLTSSYQIHGVVPKSPGMRITHHSRDSLQRAITLQTHFSQQPLPLTVAADQPSSSSTHDEMPNASTSTRDLPASQPERTQLQPWMPSMVGLILGLTLVSWACKRPSKFSPRHSP